MLDQSVPEIWRWISWGFVALGIILFISTPRVHYAKHYAKLCFTGPKGPQRLAGVAMIMAGLINALAPRSVLIGNPADLAWAFIGGVVFLLGVLFAPSYLLCVISREPKNSSV